MWARVSGTYLYPIKACAPLPVRSLAFTPDGALHGDRAWVVVDADDRITWQGAIPALARIVPTETTDALAIASADGDSAVLLPADHGESRTVHSWNGNRQAFDALNGRDAGDPAAELASHIVGQPVRLVHLATNQHRPHPVHLISLSSLRVLSAEVGCDTDLRRFRPNIVLDDAEQVLPPFAEEQATSLACVGANRRLVLSVTAPCERCIVVNVDPASTAVDNRFLKAVAAHSRRRGLAAPAAFGVYARAVSAGIVETDSRMEIVTGSRQ